MSNAASSASAAMAVSRVIGSNADYHDPHRESLPRSVLANEYIAFKSVYQKLDGASTFAVKIDSNTTDYNQLTWWSPSFTPRSFMTETFHAACIACYEEFRIRCVKVTLHSMYEQEIGLVDKQVPVLHSWLWYPKNHADLDPAAEIGTYTDLLESGESFRPLGRHRHDNLTFRCVPQMLVNAGPGNPAGGGVFKDVPAAWLPTNAANLDATLYMPYILWRPPYTSAPAFVCSYMVTMSAIIEFRNPRDSQL